MKWSGECLETRERLAMAMRINLLGAPNIDVDGVVTAGPRGSKSWAVLAYLVLTDRPVPRARLLDLLFDEAEDPAGALRWTLSQLRRALGGAAELTGDPVGLVLLDGTEPILQAAAEGLGLGIGRRPLVDGWLAEGRLADAQLFGKPESRLEVAMVHGTQLAGQHAERRLGSMSREACHTV